MSVATLRGVFLGKTVLGLNGITYIVLSFENENEPLTRGQYVEFVEIDKPETLTWYAAQVAPARRLTGGQSH